MSVDTQWHKGTGCFVWVWTNTQWHEGNALFVRVWTNTLTQRDCTLYLGVNNYTTLKKKCILCMIWTNTVTLIATKSQCSFLHKTKCLCNYCPCDQNYCQLSPLRSVLIFGINRPLFRSLWKESVNNDGQQFHQYQQENCMFESAYHIIIHISITSYQENVVF